MNNWYARGHKTEFDEDKRLWVYSDNKSPIRTINHPEGELRPCKRCDKMFAWRDPDPCLGDLPGVKNACCGHGIRVCAYVQFENGITLRGFCYPNTFDWESWNKINEDIL